MKLKMFTVYDSKLETYLPPFFMQTKGAAIRAFSDSVNDKQSNFSKHPSDYTLFEIGEYDDQSGETEKHLTKISCGVAVEFIKESI